jgi:hypothetical protein
VAASGYRARMVERLRWFPLLFFLAGSCGTPQPVDAPRTDPSASSASSAPPPFAFGPFDGLPVVAKVRSSHPAGLFQGEILASPGFPYGRAGRRAPVEGDLLVEHLRPQGSDSVSLTYVMRREAPGFFPEGGDFRYGVLGPDGRVQAEGRLLLCARCHAEAPRDHLFERGASLPKEAAR